MSIGNFICLGITLLIMIGVNKLLQKSQIDFDKKKTIKRWFNLLATAGTIAQLVIMIFPSITTSISFGDNHDNSNDSTVITNTTTNYTSTARTSMEVTTTSKSLKSTATSTIETSENNGQTYIDAIPLEIGVTTEKSFIYNEDNYEENCIWYIVNIPKDGLFTLTINCSTDVYLNTELMCLNRENCINSDRGENRQMTLETPLQSGDYYIKTSYNESGHYSIESSLESSSYSNDGEINSPYQNAKMLETDTMYGHIGYKSNEINNDDNDDYFVLQVDNNQIKKINLSMDADLSVKIRVLASDGDTELFSDYGKNKEISLQCPLIKGKYYIHIERRENYGGYKLSLTSTKVEYLEEEPNSPYQKAKGITANNTVTGSIGFVNDKKEYDEYDWFKIKVDNNSHIVLKTSAKESFKYKIQLIDTNGEDVVQSSYCYGGEEVLEYDLNPGAYYYINICSNEYGEYRFSYCLI